MHMEACIMYMTLKTQILHTSPSWCNKNWFDFAEIRSNVTPYEFLEGNREPI